MSVDTKKETLGFQTEVQQLLHLMIHSLYSNKEIFLRELISNASDAADKLRFEGLKDDSLFEDAPELSIRVEYDREQKTISVTDNGIGMSRDDVIAQLGTIAKSGTRQFFESLTGDQSKDSQLIGQFGVGFYSSFIVARQVEVLTRKAGLAHAEGVCWRSSGENDYTLEAVERAPRGTRVTLYLHEDHDEFLDGLRLRSIIRKYSDHISLPILMHKEGDTDDTDQDKEAEEETVNSATALWTRNKKDITEEEYHEFYKHVSHDFQAPLAHVHSKVEGKSEYLSLLFIPAHAPFDLWDRERRHGVKLYVRRVFIMDDAEQLLPPYLRFVKGVVDSDDLPLNVSRELLQQNKSIAALRAGCTKKILDLLAGIANKDQEKYATFWKEFGRVLKEGVMEATDKSEALAALFRFSSTHEDKAEQDVSLDAYIGRMQDGQKAIYYVTAETFATAMHSPHLEIFRKRDIEVLLLSDPIDEWLTTHLTEYQGKTLQSVTKGELALDEIAAEEDQEQTKTDSKQHEDLVARIQKVLGDKVKAVRTTQRLTTSPACLVAGEHDMGRHLEQILKASGQSIPGARPILELNPEHPLLASLAAEHDDARFSDWSHIVFDQALLSEGGHLEDPAGFVRRLNSMFLELSEDKHASAD